jgi:AcrR family transcriptional regulator
MALSTESDPTLSSGERIRRAAEELFAEHWYAATGIRDIGSRAEISTSVLYHYVSKEQLLVEIMLFGMSNLLRFAHHAVDEISNPVTQLSRLVVTHMTCEVSNRASATITDGQLHSLGPDQRPRVIAYARSTSKSGEVCCRPASRTTDSKSSMSGSRRCCWSICAAASAVGIALTGDSPLMRSARTRSTEAGHGAGEQGRKAVRSSSSGLDFAAFIDELQAIPLIAVEDDEQAATTI